MSLRCLSLRAASLLLAAFLLAACGSSSDPGGTANPNPDNPASAFCVASACGVKTRLLKIPDAENLIFSSSGRLFVSGGLNVYEITRVGNIWSATPLSASSCNFTGLALRGDVLYANCYSGALYAARLTTAPSLQMIHPYSGATAVNGLASGPEGELYAVNGPLSNAPKILRLKLDPADPLRVVEQSDWLTLTAFASQPNGVQVQGRSLYFSESAAPAPGRIRRVTIQADGAAGAITTVADLGSSVPDDFSIDGENLLATLYSSGSIALFAADGRLLSQTDANSFDSPSQLRRGRPPLFTEDELVITEKGVIGENDSDNGNALSVFRRR